MDEIENLFLKRMEENEKNNQKPNNNHSSQPSFSLFNLTQKQDSSVEESVTYNTNISKDTILLRESQVKSDSSPTFFPPPKVMDVEINQVETMSGTDGSEDEDESREMDIPNESHSLDQLTSDDDNEIEPSVGDELPIEDLEVGTESASIREEIFMMLEEEMEEEANLLKVQENDQIHALYSIEQSGISNDDTFEESNLNSILDLDSVDHHQPSFNQFLETIYCEKKSNPVVSKNTDFVRSIGSLTSVLKKISTERVKMNETQDIIKVSEHDDTKLTALKEHFEHELLSAEHLAEDVIETAFSGSRSLTVKIPVVLSTLRIEVDIFEELDLPYPIEHIQSIQWSIKSLKAHIPTPSSIVFLKGTLIASIEYVNSRETSSVHSVKIPIQWNHTCPTRWIHPPDIPMSDQREYTFLEDDSQDTITHQESHSSFCDSIQHFLQDYTFISQQECIKQNGRATLKIQGCLQLCLHFTQEQFVQIQSENLL